MVENSNAVVEAFLSELTEALRKVFTGLVDAQLVKVRLPHHAIEVKGYYNYLHLIRIDLKRLDNKPFFD